MVQFQVYLPGLLKKQLPPQVIILFIKFLKMYRVLLYLTYTFLVNSQNIDDSDVNNISGASRMLCSPLTPGNTDLPNVVLCSTPIPPEPSKKIIN